MTEQTQALVKLPGPGELMRKASDVAGICKAIVLATAVEIERKKYVKVEGWTAIAQCHGYVAGSRDVQWIEAQGDRPAGYRAIGELRNIDTGHILNTAEGFVGTDEVHWFGGEAEVWDRRANKRIKKTYPKRDDYAIRSMAATRAVSKVCRLAFPHVIILMNAGLSTTPAEEVPPGGFDDVIDVPAEPVKPQPKPTPSPTPATESPAQKKTRLIAMFKDVREAAKECFCEAGFILPTEDLEDIHETALAKLTKRQVQDMLDECKKRTVPHGTSSDEPPLFEDEVPAEGKVEAWRLFKVPFGKHAGTDLGLLDRKVLWGFWANYEPETEYQGKPLAPDKVAKNQAFREALDEAGKHYDFKPPEDKT